MFVGAVSDNFDERIDQKIFHAEIVVDVARGSAETKAYQPIPIIADFTNENGLSLIHIYSCCSFTKMREVVKLSIG